MSSPAEEIAADYRAALEDLFTNTAAQIGTLTAVAKDNIEHAQAISAALTAHIKKAPPARKLPALYVLDSLLKNIRSPYTVYLASNLHETFMLAYSQVDPTVRPKMEVMLGTWRKPVIGSHDPEPVLPLSATQSIVDALTRFKAATAQRPSQAALRAPSIVQAQAVHYRNTPTPPHAFPYQQPPPIHYRQPTPTPQAQYQPQQYYQQPPQPTPTPHYPAYPPQNHTPVQQNFPQLPFPQQNGHLPVRPHVDVRKLHTDIDDLTTDAKIDCMTHPMDQSKTKKLETLQSLKALLDSGTLVDQDIREVRTTIDKEMEKRNAEKLAASHIRQAPTPQPPYQPPPQWQPPNIYQQQPQFPPVPTPQQYQPPAQAQPQQYQQPPTQALPSFAGTNLADLLRHAQNKSAAQNVPTPVPPYAVPASSTPTLSNAQPAPANGVMSFLDQFRASGLLSKIPTPVPGPPPTVPYIQPMDDVPFTSVSIKIPRPHLVLKFIHEKPNQCSTCGRRFTSDDTGKAKKEKHLDWHFKTKTRSLEAEQRGQNRSWYVDEHEWIISKEYEDDLGMEDPAAATNGTTPANAVKKEVDYVRTPSDPAYRNAVCPIDQEPFKSEWSGEIQDFIWRDAVKVGDRYYHASCYKEAMKTKEVAPTVRAGTPLAGAGLGHKRTATPDSVLGKRKAEDDEPSSASKSRLKIEA
ncbi:mRNA 3' end processing factor [Knufia fluminis]|uniref:mRNA 3' end processing factor n=1 Tax=Knufia fluminis TaxID=191047 RepID=A0AAN8EEP4_9EURO|nr:mRNA 3' end processing factor [Knufia fluminis]